MSPDSISAYLNLGRDKLLGQENLHREFSDRILKMAGYSGLMIGFGLTILKIGEACTKNEPYLFMGQGLMFIVIAVITMIMVHPSRWHTSPDMEEVAKKLKDYPSSAVVRAIGNTYGEAIASNRMILQRKADLLKYASWAVLVQIFLLAWMTVFSVL